MTIGPIRFSVSVSYVPPSRAELQRRFDWVHGLYFRNPIEPSIAGVPTGNVTRIVMFELLRLSNARWKMTLNEVLAYIRRRGMRPSCYEELLSVVAARPALLDRYSLIALGSCLTMTQGGLRAPCAHIARDGKRSLDICYVDIGWNETHAFLTVPQSN